MIGPKVPKPSAAESRAARAEVQRRSGGMCEGCGRRPKSDRHHRQHGAAGRVDTVDNLLDLCGGPGGMPGGNHSGCHGVAHSGDGYFLGWSVKGGNDPADIPVYHRRGDVWKLRGEPIAYATAAAHMVDRGVARDVATFVRRVEAIRDRWALEAVAR